MQILSIRTDDTQAIMSLELDDGSLRDLTYPQLRTACRCAECIALQRRGGALDGTGVALETLAAVGSNALNLHFSDGHQRGIYPLEYLVELALGGKAA